MVLKIFRTYYNFFKHYVPIIIEFYSILFVWSVRNLSFSFILWAENFKAGFIKIAG